MQRRIETVLILKIYNDETANFCYLKVLTRTTCETIRLNQSIGKNKSVYMLQPFYLLEVELIKTSKNWILNDVSNYHPLIKPNGYSDYEKIINLQKLLSSRLEQGQEVEIIDFVINYLKMHSIVDIELEKFDNELLAKLGFLDGEQLDNKDTVTSGKYNNHL